MYLTSLDRKKRESTEGSARVTQLTVAMARWANSLSVGIREGLFGGGSFLEVKVVTRPALR